MKKALIHDWFSVYAGAEKCIESFTNIWNDFEVYSLIDFLNDKDRNIILKGKYANTSFVQNLPKAKVQKVGEANNPQLVELYVDFR